MAGKQSSYQRNLERITKDLLSTINKDEILKQMTAEDLVRGLNSKEQLSRLNLEEQRRLKRLLNKLIETN